ncbi:MAG: HAD family hydrolase [Spirochaetaceae bacterium]|jgi:putative hydrolase of the HAD superfamily|nr:HAD family hydrolase [Spirochaetaceae bacterium]
MPRDIAAAAFDVDGTLYPEWRLYSRTWRGVFLNPRLFAAFARTRGRLRRRGAPVARDSFYELQAEICAEELGLGGRAAKVKAEIERHIYGSVERFFDGIKPYPHLKECLLAMKKSGLKLAVLSDFPIGGKLRSLRLDGLWDAELCSEETGALKPHPLPFLRLAESLDLSPNRILYVGNNPAYDIEGAQNAGMTAALRCFCPLIPPARGRNADFVFNGYRSFQEYVLR